MATGGHRDCPSGTASATASESAWAPATRGGGRLINPAWPLGACGYELAAADQIIVHLFGLEGTATRKIRHPLAPSADLVTWPPLPLLGSTSTK